MLIKNKIISEFFITNLIKTNISKIKKNKFHFFNGDIGSGKTTLISQIIKRLTCKSIHTNSPTYSYYLTIEFEKIKIIHIDFFKCQSESIKMQILEYSENFNYCFIEWGDDVKIHVQKYFLWEINYVSEKNRNYKLKQH